MLIRSSREGERLVCLVVNAGTQKAAERGFRHRMAELVKRLTEEPQKEGADAAGCGAGALCTTVTLNLNPKKTNVILGDETIVLAGSGYITERLSVSMGAAAADAGAAQVPSGDAASSRASDTADSPDSRS